MTNRAHRPDVQADIELREALDQTPRKSFLMLAGAGSGKTTSLVKALVHIGATQGADLRRQGQKIACVTYTETAVEEIKSDIGNTDVYHVSTIHSFLWTLVRPFQTDLRNWVDARIVEKMQEASERMERPGTQERTRVRLAEDIERYRAQRAALGSVRNFNYGTGSEYAKGILGHDDIIKVGTFLLKEKVLLRNVVANGYPYIFVDESQDTFPEVVDALKAVSRDANGRASLGFFGDQMQKIYLAGAGKIDGETGWLSVTKAENFRCPTTVLSVINSIRAEDDGLIQTGGRAYERDGQLFPVHGSAQIFILPVTQRDDFDGKVRSWMAQAHDDPLWLDDDDNGNVRVLVLVHRMAANRLGFPNLYAALNDNGTHRLKDGLLDGSAWILRTFLSTLLPLADFLSAGAAFDVVRLLRRCSPALSDEALTEENARPTIDALRDRVAEFANFWADESTATVRDVAMFVKEHQIAALDDRFDDYLVRPHDAATIEGDPPEAAAALALLRCPAKELQNYRRYIEDRSPFKTQQGTKGAEFERVLVLLDDDEAAYNLFSFGKYFGFVPLSATDQARIDAGEDSVLARTRRLFYVCCSRAEKDLVVVLFANDVNAAREAVLSKGLFPADAVFGSENLPE